MSDDEHSSLGASSPVANADRLGNRANHEARELREVALAAADAGDYKRARQLDAQVARLPADPELALEASREAQSLAPDPAAVLAGIVGLAFAVACWLVALWAA